MNKHDGTLDRNWTLLRLRQAIECAEKIKAAANWDLVNQRSDQLIAAATELFGLIEKTADAVPSDRPTGKFTAYVRGSGNSA